MYEPMLQLMHCIVEKKSTDSTQKLEILTEVFGLERNFGP